MTVAQKGIMLTLAWFLIGVVFGHLDLFVFIGIALAFWAGIGIAKVDWF